MAEHLLEVINLKKYFYVSKRQTLKAVDDISFTIDKGKTLGLVGESGCGKTTVGRTILRFYDIDGGKVLFKGKNIHKLSRKLYRSITKEMQMIFQDPYSSLNPRKIVGDIVGEGLDIHGLYNTKKERKEKIYELLNKVGLNKEHVNRFPHEFSGGQRQRIGIARALSVNPRFIVCDEAISALDVSIQGQIINLLIDLQEELNLTYLFISHDLSMVRYISEEIAVMYLGNIVEKASTEEIFKKPLHPYTVGLISAIPTPDPHYEKARVHNVITGEVPSPINPLPGCRFYSRCKYSKPICKETMPPLKDVGNNHLVSCFMIQSANW